MKDKILEFMKKRSNNLFHERNTIYICLGGSYVIGTFAENSDIDARAVISPDDNSTFGLNEFNMTKLVEGESGINNKDDADLEVYSVRKFFQDLYRGDVVTVEMALVPDEFKVHVDPGIIPIFDNKEIFVTTSVARSYNSFAYGLFQKAFKSKIDQSVRKDKIERLQDYHYETKSAMKSFMYFEMVLEILSGKGLTITRPNSAELLAIKNGKYSSAEMMNILTDMNTEAYSKLKESTLPKNPNFNEVNDLCKKVMKYYLG